MASGQFENKLDQWILSDLAATVEKVTERLDAYDLSGATVPLLAFLDGLTNWYIRRSRRRFWKSENDGDKKQAYSALYIVLKTLSQLLAPYTPFIAEEVYRNLTGETSVHLSTWPKVQKQWLNTDLNDEVDLVRTVVTLGLSARAKSKIKVRQPLGLLEVIVPHEKQAVILSYREIILEELNVKELKLLEESGDVAQKVLKPVGAKIGPRFGKDAQKIFNAAKENKYVENSDGTYTLTDPVTGFSDTLSKDEVEIAYLGKEGFDVESDKGIVVALDTHVTEELKQEGVARDIVRTIQVMRKEANYNVSDRITVSISGCEQIVLEKFGAYILQETLSELVPQLDSFDLEREVELDEGTLHVRIKK